MMNQIWNRMGFLNDTHLDCEMLSDCSLERIVRNVYKIVGEIEHVIDGNLTKYL